MYMFLILECLPLVLTDMENKYSLSVTITRSFRFKYVCVCVFMQEKEAMHYIFMHNAGVLFAKVSANSS